MNQFGKRSATSQKKDLIKILLIKKNSKYQYKNSKPYGDKTTTDFQDQKGKKKIPKTGSHCFCLSERVPDLVYRMKNDDDNYDDDDDDDDDDDEVFTCRFF